MVVYIQQRYSAETFFIAYSGVYNKVNKFTVSNTSTWI